MSRIGQIASKVREFMSTDRDSRVLNRARGMTSPFGLAGASDMMQSYNRDLVREYLRLDYDLMSRYLDYEYMDDYPMISTALNILAADATQTDVSTGKIVWIESNDHDLQTLLNDFLHRVIRVDEKMPGIARETASYGNFFGEITIDHDGVIDWRGLPPPTMRKVEGPNSEVHGYVQDFRRRDGFTVQEFYQVVKEFQANGGAPGELPSSVMGLGQALPFEPWQVTHIKMPSKWSRSVYGYALTETARWAWKRLVLLEDSAMLFRIQRSPERFAFYIDVTGRSGQEAMKLLHWAKQMYKKKRVINPQTNQIELRLDMLAPDEDFFIPTQDGREGTRIENLNSPQWQSLDDLNYFRTMLVSALQTPRMYLGIDDDMGGGSGVQTAPSSSDVRFARTVLGLQTMLKGGVAQVCRVHLASLGIPPEAAQFTVKMAVPSAIFELAQIEVLNAKADLAGRMGEHVSLPYTLRNVYGLSDTDIEIILKERIGDKVREAEGEAAAAKVSGEGGGMFASRRAPDGTPLWENHWGKTPISREMMEVLTGGSERGRKGSGLNRRNANAMKGRGELDPGAILKMNQNLLATQQQTLHHLREMQGLLRGLAASAGR